MSIDGAGIPVREARKRLSRGARARFLWRRTYGMVMASLFLRRITILLRARNALTEHRSPTGVEPLPTAGRRVVHSN